MTTRFLPFALLCLFCFYSCANEDKGDTGSEAKADQNIYFDYMISGDEEEDDVACVLRFRKGGKNGNAVLLRGNSKVELDGQPIAADSAGLSGVFYEVRKPVSEFAGVHRVTFTGSDKKQYTEEFTFSPFTLKNDITELVSRSDFRIELNGAEQGARIRVVLMDTAVHSNGLNEVVTVSDGTIHFSREQLQKVKNGPVTMLLSLEQERPVKNGTPKGGKLNISYGLRRDFVMVN